MSGGRSDLSPLVGGILNCPKLPTHLSFTYIIIQEYYFEIQGIDLPETQVNIVN